MVLHVLMVGNLFMVAKILLLIQLFSSHHPSSVPLSSEDTSLLDHTHTLSHFPLKLSTVPGGPRWRRAPSPSLLRCWNKSSLQCLVRSPCMGLPQHIPTRDLPLAHKGERQILLSNKHTPILHNHTYTYTYTQTFTGKDCLFAYIFITLRVF